MKDSPQVAVLLRSEKAAEMCCTERLLNGAQDIGLTNLLYGLGAGLFFVGYFVAQLPSNVLIIRVGAKRWLALLLFCWGAVTICTAGACHVLGRATHRVDC